MMEEETEIRSVAGLNNNHVKETATLTQKLIDMAKEKVRRSHHHRVVVARRTKEHQRAVARIIKEHRRADAQWRAASKTTDERR